MPPRSLLSSIVLAGVAATLPLATPTTAKAQSLIDFLWGGTKEWGGGKQSVSFDPKYTAGQIIVSFGDRRLYLITGKGQAISYPIAVPREKSRWQGTTTISNKRVNPSWRPTAEMLQENPKLPHWVPGGHPMNPLGVRALYLGASAYRIHGTDAPWTIGKAVSQGCIRMNNEDVLDLYPRVPVGTRVTVTWERFSTGQAIASYDDAPTSDEAPTHFHPASYGAPPRPAVRQLPPLPRSVRAAQTAAVRMEPVESPAKSSPVTEKKPAKPTATKATDAKVAEPKPVTKKAETDKISTATATSNATSAAEAATRAAAAAAKAAAVAREAAETAKKAAADAKKATSTGAAKEPDKKAEPGKSAAL
jgi:lipoprotein-anchoring transpeptidase ErfK/SrfK